MKNEYVIIIVIFGITMSNLSCKKRINKEIWLQTTYCHNSASYGSINLFAFEDDSIFIQTYMPLDTWLFSNWDTTSNDKEDSLEVFNFELFKSGIYEAKDKELIITIDTKPDTFEITDWSSSQLKLSGIFKNCYNSEFEEVGDVTFIKLPTYNQSENEEKLKYLLEKNFYELKIPIDDCNKGQVINIEFFKNNHFQFSKMNECSYTVHSQFWYIEKYNNELFLIFDLAYPLHIKSVTDKKIIGVLHKEKNIIFEFTKTPIKQNFKKENLFGKWEEKNPNVAPPAPDKKWNIPFYNREYLEINDKYIINNKWHKSDTLEYKIGKSDEFIIFPNTWNEYNKRRWEIIELSNQELKIERQTDVLDRMKKTLTTFKRIRK